MIKDLKKYLLKIKYCPICSSKKITNIGIINSNRDDLNNLFNLLQCLNCNHRFLSKFPKEKFLNKLYLNNSDYVFGHTADENIKKEKFIEKKFKNILAYNDHWIFNYIKKEKKGRYLEIGPGLCNLYKAFYSIGWKCEGVELQSWIKAPGIVNSINKIKKEKKDIVVMLDVLEHSANPIKLLKSISKKHKISGKLFLCYPNSGSFKSKILRTKWPMVSPLGHINFFSKKSTLIMLKKCGYEPILIKSYSFVIFRRLFRNAIKLPFKIIIDILKFNFLNIYKRLFELILNILDLMNGDQIKVVAKRIK